MASSRDSGRLPTADDFKPNSLRGKPDFFRVGQARTGRWWLVDPHGRGYFARAVAGVNQAGRADGGAAAVEGGYAAQVAAAHGGDGSAFARGAIRRLRNWHFNTLGAWTDRELDEQGMYSTATLELLKAGPFIHSGDARLPDVFDPEWSAAVEARVAAVCAGYRSSRELIGYFTDHELSWAQPSAETAGARREAGGAATERPSLLQICLSLEPSARAYHAAWEFVLAPRHGDLEALAGDWKLPLPNKETLRQLTQEERPLLTAGYLRDQKRFAREFARRYFSISAAAIRAHDPGHLILGCRFGRYPGGAILAESVYPNVDVVTAQPENEAWEKTAQSYHSANGMPVWMVGVNWAREKFMQVPGRREVRGFTSVERMLRNGRQALERLCDQRSVVGYEWSHWADAEGEEAPFGSGLVHVNDHEAREHTEALAALNARIARGGSRAGG